MQLFIKLAFPLLIFFALGCVARNIDADVDKIATNDSGKMHVVASMITADVEKKIALFEGGVKIFIRQGFIISADNAKFGYSDESRLKFIELIDNAILIRNGEKIICDRIYIDCISGSIKYYKNVMIHENGKVIEKEEELYDPFFKKIAPDFMLTYKFKGS